MAEVQNPYIAGSPLSGTEMFFGREDVFDFVRQTLAREHGDQVIVLYGQRRTGKTSVLKQLHRHLDARYLCIFIDLHLLELNGLNGFLWQLARNIRRELEREHGIALPALDRETFMADARDSFRGLFLDQVWAAIGDRQLVLMIDEAVRLQEQISAGRLERDVFDYLRHLMQHYPQLQFLFSLGSGLEEMEREYAFLFSVGLYRKISFLERPVAEALITEPVRGCYELEPAAVDRIYQTTSGHPYYTQLLCHSLFNRWHEHPKDRLAEADVDGVLEEVTERGSAALKNVWDDSTPGERVVMAGLAAAIGDEARTVRTSDLAPFWREHGLEIAPGEVVRAIRSLFGRDILVGEECPTFTVEMQRRWIEKWCRPDWIRQEVADALTAEADKAAPGVVGPLARSYTLIDPTPVPPESELPPPIQVTTKPASLRSLLSREFNLSHIWLIVLVMAAVSVTVLVITFPRSDPAPPAPEARPPTEVPAAKAGPPTTGTGTSTPGVALAPTATQAASSGAVQVTPTAGTPIASDASVPPQTEAPRPTLAPPPALRGDELHPLIFDAADKHRIPRVALLALARAETDRRSDMVEPATLEEALKTWPAVYAGWARQRVALTDIGELLLDPGGNPPPADLLERVINSAKKAGPAGDRAAAMLAGHLRDPNPTHDQILNALIAYRAQNTGDPPAEVDARRRGDYQNALVWAEQQVQAAALPSPVAAVITPPAVGGTPVAPASVTAVTAQPTSRYNPAEPTVLQVRDWEDSAAATTWMLKSLGRDVTLANVSEEMLRARVVSTNLGLLNASGADLAQFIKARWNERAFNKPTVTFDDVAGMAGRNPQMICGRSWGHCTAVRNMSADQRILLANPGGTGPRYGQQSLSREQFEVLGPFSAVWIEP